jgi:hypothetical protein
MRSHLANVALAFSIAALTVIGGAAILTFVLLAAGVFEKCPS